LPPAVRNRLLRRALSFAPSAIVAIGDQVYWDLLAPENGPKMGASPAAERIAGTFDRSALVLGSDNETVLKRAVEPQLIPVYGTDFRSTPVRRLVSARSRYRSRDRKSTRLNSSH